jgi:hypothetical protein
MRRALPWRNLIYDPRVIAGVTILGVIVYLVQSWVFAHTQFSLLDEGAYLYKGYLFATGKYHLYQDYGPWTNHMPLAFLIPGYIQLLFGPGLRTGRYLAIALGVLMVLGLWALARRLRGRWWGVLAVWAMALNPAVIKLYSLANSQALLACMLIWVLVLSLGKDRQLWQILSGSALAGIMLMTRVNMAPVLILLLAYIFWQNGWRVGLLATAAGGLPVVMGHALYWPAILRIWAHWLPPDLVPFLRPWGHPVGSDPIWKPQVAFEMRVISFLYGIRFHFFALVGAAAAWIFWPRRKDWWSISQFRMAIFLSVLLVIMVLSHMWASLGKDYCVFCFPVYLSFFTGLGIILLIITFSSWKRMVSRAYQLAIYLVILSMMAGIGFSSHRDMGTQLVSGDLVRSLLAVQVPRLRDFQLLPGSVAIWGVLSNLYGLSYSMVVQSSLDFLRMLVPTLLGVLAGLILIVIAIRFNRRLYRQRRFELHSRGWVALSALLLMGLILSPSKILGGGYDNYDCGGDILRNYELAGDHLKQEIPDESLVYWDGGDSTVPLLYLPNIKIFPAQINGVYSLRRGGDPDALARYGFWSEELAHRWAQEADIILIEEQNYHGWLRELVESGAYDELPATPPLLDCRDNSAIHIFRKSANS